jgi:hypothetical protein
LYNLNAIPTFESMRIVVLLLLLTKICVGQEVELYCPSTEFVTDLSVYINPDTAGVYIRKFADNIPSRYTNGIEGVVYLQVQIDNNGNAINPVIKRGLNNELDSICLTIINHLPKWNVKDTASINYLPYYNIPIRIRHD